MPVPRLLPDTVGRPWPSRHQYKKVDNAESSVHHTPEAQPLRDGSFSDLDSEGGLDCRHREGKPPTWRPHWVLFAAALLTTSILSAISGAAIGKWTSTLGRRCAAHTSQYSPVLSNVDVTYAVQQFNGSFMKQNVYRLSASPQADAAWEALGVGYRAGVIGYEEGIRSGLTPAHVQRADKYGGGFFVNVEGMHHLHCLNLVRKALFYNYDYYKKLGTHAFKNDDHILQLHVSHCLDIVRQVLMCNVDTGVLGQVWYNKEHPAAFPDFNTRHKCKNYDGIRSWAEMRQEPPPETLPEDYMKLAASDDVLPDTP